jgi:TP901 family phage tail tape measure protein
VADRTVAYRFIGNFSNLTAGLAASGKAVGDFGTKLTALDKNGAKMRAGLTTVGATAGKIGFVAAAGLAAVVGVTAHFEKAMSSVQAATHETAANMELLRAAAIKAGADTAYSASEAAGAIEELAKAGVSTKDILAGGLAGSLNLAAAGGIEVAEAAELAATALTQFSLSGSDVNHVADLLAAGAGKAQGSVDDLGMALKQSGLVAAQTGLSIEETTGTLAAFASAGLIGSDAGTSFKTMLQSLTPSGDKAAGAMEKLGITAYDAQGNFIGMTEFAANLRNGLKDLSVEQQNAALKTIFGSDAVRAAAVIYDQGAVGIQSWIDKPNDSGYAAETAATRLDNLAGDIEKLKGSLETALIGAGSGSQAPLRSLVQNIDDVVNAFNDAPPAIQGLTTKLLGLTAITGGALWFGSKVINGIASTKTALGQLGVSAGVTRGMLASIGKGLQFAAIGIAVSALTDQIEDLGNTALEGDLNRNL